MNATALLDTAAPDFTAGRPRRSAPIRAIAKPFGPIGRRMAGTRVFPLWGIVRHTGRSSGKTYATPVVVRPTPGGFLIPLPFGDAIQWAKNLYAAGGGSIRFAGREYPVDEPQILDLETVSAHLPLPIRFVSRRLGLRHWVSVRISARSRPTLRRVNHQPRGNPAGTRPGLSVFAVIPMSEPHIPHQVGGMS